MKETRIEAQSETKYQQMSTPQDYVMYCQIDINGHVFMLYKNV